MQEKSIERTVQLFSVFCQPDLNLIILLALASLYGPEWVNLAAFQLPAGKGTALSPPLCVCVRQWGWATVAPEVYFGNM